LRQTTPKWRRSDRLSCFDEVHARRQPYVGITFMKRYVRGRAITDRMGRWLKETEDATRKYCLAAGLISQSATFRFALSAVFPHSADGLSVCGQWEIRRR
jgi:hypothetical protein